jgi:hypothetical protein
MKWNIFNRNSYFLLTEKKSLENLELLKKHIENSPIFPTTSEEINKIINFYL